MIAPEARLSVTRQCALLWIARSSFYYRPRPECAGELEALKRLDRKRSLTATLRAAAGMR
jgi:hypothetical protein